MARMGGVHSQLFSQYDVMKDRQSIADSESLPAGPRVSQGWEAHFSQKQEGPGCPVAWTETVPLVPWG